MPVSSTNLFGTFLLLDAQNMKTQRRRRYPALKNKPNDYQRRAGLDCRRTPLTLAHFGPPLHVPDIRRSRTGTNET